ncbi:hypothetical protein ACTHSL_11300 [Neisseria sp. P0008.S010]|uniref:hypothetical protein n=1 Tax=Neisseria sp. P0008.S010 TaxID=3436707 RepID=UPI003F821FCB
MVFSLFSLSSGGGCLRPSESLNVRLACVWAFDIPLACRFGNGRLSALSVSVVKPPSGFVFLFSDGLRVGRGGRLKRF